MTAGLTIIKAIISQLRASAAIFSVFQRKVNVILQPRSRFTLLFPGDEADDIFIFADSKYTINRTVYLSATKYQSKHEKYQNVKFWAKELNSCSVILFTSLSHCIFPGFYFHIRKNFMLESNLNSWHCFSFWPPCQDG